MRTMRLALVFGFLSTLLLSSRAFAHHAMDGRAPVTFLDGLLSGLAHPVIGLDHLLAIIAVGLLSARMARGGLVAGTFVVSGLLGTGLHLPRIDLPALEVIVAGTVALLGVLVLWAHHRPAGDRLPGWVLSASAIAGVFHGYAYGESIVGAETAPVAAYLLGFTAVQLGLILVARRLGRLATERIGLTRTPLRALPGGVLSAAGVVLLVIALQS